DVTVVDNRVALHSLINEIVEAVADEAGERFRIEVGCFLNVVDDIVNDRRSPVKAGTTINVVRPDAAHPGDSFRAITGGDRSLAARAADRRGMPERFCDDTIRYCRISG